MTIHSFRDPRLSATIALAGIGLGLAAIPDARTIAFGFLLNASFVAWTSRLIMVSDRFDRRVAQLASGAVALALLGLLVTLTLPATSVAIAIALAIAIAILSAALAATPMPVLVPGETRLTDRQWTFVLGGGTLSVGIVAVLIGSEVSHSGPGTVAGRADVVVAASASILAVISGLASAPRQWRRPYVAAAAVGICMVIDAILAEAGFDAHPDLALGTVVVVGSVAFMIAAMAFGTIAPAHDDPPATLGAALRIATIQSVWATAIILAIIVAWGLRRRL